MTIGSHYGLRSPQSRQRAHGRRPTRPDPTPGRQRQTAAYGEMLDTAQTYMARYKGGGKKGYSKGKSGKGWFGAYIPEADFRARLAMKGKGKGKSKGFRQPFRAAYGEEHQAWPAFLAQAEEEKESSDSKTQTAYAGGTKVEKAMYVRGHAVCDFGCTKAMVSEYCKRDICRLMKDAGVEQPEFDRQETTTRYKFAEGSKNLTKPAYKCKLASFLYGKPLVSEWEVLEKGDAPPLMSLPQFKNLHAVFECTPTKVLFSSKVLGVEKVPLLEANGHLHIDLVNGSMAGVRAGESGFLGTAHTPTTSELADSCKDVGTGLDTTNAVSYTHLTLPTNREV